jgi:hypothetical protein
VIGLAYHHVALNIIVMVLKSSMLGGGFKFKRNVVGPEPEPGGAPSQAKPKTPVRLSYRMQ